MKNIINVSIGRSPACLVCKCVRKGCDWTKGEWHNSLNGKNKCNGMYLTAMKTGVCAPKLLPNLFTFFPWCIQCSSRSFQGQV